MRIDGRPGVNLTLEHSGTDDLGSFRRMIEKIDYLVSSRAIIDTIRPIVPGELKFWNIVKNWTERQLKC